jgi:hypothetical protein
MVKRTPWLRIGSFLFSTLILFMLLGADHYARMFIISVVFSIELLFIFIVANLGALLNLIFG